MLVLIVPFCLFAQTVQDGCNAGSFGIDGDLYANGSQLGNIAGTTGTDDWFEDQNIYTGAALGVISEDSTAIWNNPSVAYLSLSADMSQVANAIINGVRWQDGIYARDFYGGTGYSDNTSYTSSGKNGENPELWPIGPANITPKNDLIDCYGHLRRNGGTSDSDLWLNAGFSRISNSGESYLGLELFAKDIYIDPNTGQFVTAGNEDGHTSWLFDNSGNILRAGDLVVSVVFSTSSDPEIELRAWVSKDDYDNINPVSFDFGSEFDGDGTAATYGYASILTPMGTTTISCAKANDESTPAPPWGSINSSGDYSVTAP